MTSQQVREERLAIIVAIQQARDVYAKTKAELLRKLDELCERCPHERTSDVGGVVECDDCFSKVKGGE